MIKPRATVGLAAFLAAAASANYLTAALGLVTVPGTSWQVAAGTWCAGVALVARDAVQETGGPRLVAAAIVAGAAVSLLGAPVRIALASAFAFAVSEVLDAAVYEPLRRRGQRAAGVLISSLVAAPVDSGLFLALSGLGLSASALAGQWAVKVALAAVAALVLLGVRRAVPRERQQPAGA